MHQACQKQCFSNFALGQHAWAKRAPDPHVLRYLPQGDPGNQGSVEEISLFACVLSLLVLSLSCVRGDV